MNKKTAMLRKEDCSRFIAQFEYDDLVNKLLDVKFQRKEIVSRENSKIEREINLGHNHRKLIGSKMTKKQRLCKAISDREIHSGEIVLPKIRTPIVGVEKLRLNGSGELTLDLKSSLNLKLQSINKSKNQALLSYKA